jgi:catechol O-methyltransferase
LLSYEKSNNQFLNFEVAFLLLQSRHQTKKVLMMTKGGSDDEDPFSCFGDDDDEMDSSNRVASTKGTLDASAIRSTPPLSVRDPSCGVLAFHYGTEKSLLRHVQLELTSDRFTSIVTKNPITTTNHQGEAEGCRTVVASLVLQLVDEFCLSRHWMMHVGQEKGVVVQQFLKECHDRFFDTTTTNVKSSSRPLILVELGTYCGYSSILLANTLKEQLQCSLFHIFSVEVVPENVQVANELIRLAELEHCITVLLLENVNEGYDDNDDDEKESSLLAKRLEQSIKAKFPGHYCSPENFARIDFLFIDHAKSLYLRDLQVLEQARMIREGSFVAADNVVFAAIDDYRHYFGHLCQQGIAQSQLKEGFLEYCQPDCLDASSSQQMRFRDGIGTLLQYVSAHFVGERQW